MDLCQSKHLPVSNRAAPQATPGRRIFYKTSSNSSSRIQLTTVDFLSSTRFLVFSYNPAPKVLVGDSHCVHDEQRFLADARKCDTN